MTTFLPASMRRASLACMAAYLTRRRGARRVDLDRAVTVNVQDRRPRELVDPPRQHVTGSDERRCHPGEIETSAPQHDVDSVRPEHGLDLGRVLERRAIAGHAAPAARRDERDRVAGRLVGELRELGDLLTEALARSGRRRCRSAHLKPLEAVAIGRVSRTEGVVGARAHLQSAEHHTIEHLARVSAYGGDTSIPSLMDATSRITGGTEDTRTS
jgi:hypothetical protein